MVLTENQRYPSFWHNDECPSPYSLPVKSEPKTSTPHVIRQLKSSDSPSSMHSPTASMRQSLLSFSSKTRDNLDEVTVAMTGESLAGTMESPRVKVEEKEEAVVDVSTIASPVSIPLHRAKQTVLEPVTQKTYKKPARYRSADTRPVVTSTITTTRPRGRPRSKATSLSPKKKSTATGKLAPDSELGHKTTSRQTQLTTYGIRRTARQFMKDKEREREVNVLEMLRENVEVGMKIIVTDEKGRGIVAAKTFYDGDFVVEYAGNLIPEKLAKKREAEYKQDPAIGSYMFYFVHNGQKYCVDATAETYRLGRLINHSRLHPNCHVKVIPLHGVPRLVLFAKQLITPGEELLYDYGDRDKETLEIHPWLKT